jgi:putative transposase
MTPDPATCPGYRFPAEVIRHAVWLSHVVSLSLREVELILAGRGMTVTHEGIRNWCRKFGAGCAAKLRRRRPKPGDTWHLDEVFLRISGVLHYLWRGWTSTAWCWISSFRIGGTEVPPSGSSGACLPVSSINPAGWSLTG